MTSPIVREAEVDANPADLQRMNTVDDGGQRIEYTRRHRASWPLMTQGPDAESLVASELTSWLRLWGRLGAELYRCFRDGDAHIRTDMIALARMSGWRGEIIADRLEGWRRQLLDA